jgi:hypothetical protein
MPTIAIDPPVFVDPVQPSVGENYSAIEADWSPKYEERMWATTTPLEFDAQGN